MSEWVLDLVIIALLVLNGIRAQDARVFLGDLAQRHRNETQHAIDQLWGELRDTKQAVQDACGDLQLIDTGLQRISDEIRDLPSTGYLEHLQARIADLENAVRHVSDKAPGIGSIEYLDQRMTKEIRALDYTLDRIEKRLGAPGTARPSNGAPPPDGPNGG
jgi:chromosome segregation ATPase